MATSTVTKGVQQTSIRHFLSESAICIFLFALLATTHSGFREQMVTGAGKEYGILLGALVLFSAYPIGLAINGLSFFSLLHWINRFEEQIFKAENRLPGTRDILDAGRSVEVFCLEDYGEYRRRVKMFEELEFVVDGYGVSQGHTIGIEQFLRNLAFMSVPVALLYLPQAAAVTGASQWQALVPMLLAGLLAMFLLIWYAASVRFYRSFFYFSALIELRMIYFLESLEPTKSREEGQRVLYETVHRLANREVKSDAS